MEYLECGKFKQKIDNVLGYISNQELGRKYT